ncbi:hypothetical protein AVEN_192001-1 [Araneus ventricosus]|uniref:Uncharacterized protein n=1 Tax=Araneus ventricosus TaxID=182803 RepID=A0A4Y2J9B3_ARAVE|nr:hypothetical protein AVEN_192001-1 [Araneus ventricosus]
MVISGVKVFERKMLGDKDLGFAKCGFRTGNKCSVRDRFPQDLKVCGEIFTKQDLKKRHGFMKGPTFRFQALLGLLLCALHLFNVGQAGMSK